MIKLTVGSLFAGIGGIELGLESTGGFEVIWQVEVDDFATKVLEKRWPEVERFRDIRDIRVGDLKQVDIITGGFPCQDISRAGKGAGIEGEKSGLWREFKRIICYIRPKFVVVENVSAIRFRGLGRVLGDLAEIGYDAEWESLSAASFGAKHIRTRVFIVSYPSGKRRSRKNTKSVISRRPEGLFTECDWWKTQPVLGRVVDGFSDRMDSPRIKCLGKAVVPQVAFWLGRRILEYEELI